MDLAPWLGPAASLPLVLLVVIWLAARWLVRRFPAPTGTAPRSHFLRVGLLALAFIVAAEMLLGWKLRGLTPLEYFTLRDPVSGTAYYLSLAIFALLPARLSRYQA